jgi:hypothetical protein
MSLSMPIVRNGSNISCTTLALSLDLQLQPSWLQASGKNIQGYMLRVVTNYSKQAKTT